jgi:uncharacterized protein (DUF4415 family)
MRPPLRPELRPLTDKDGEVRELTAEDFKSMRPIAEADPGMLEAVEDWRKHQDAEPPVEFSAKTRRLHPELVEAYEERRNRGGRPKAEAPKVHVSFRLAADVVERVKASGKGYNARVERALSEALAKGKI